MKNYVLNQGILDTFIDYIVKTKYKNKIQKLKIDYIDDTMYIKSFLIKKNVRNKGFGSAVINFLIKIADAYNVRIKFDTFTNLKRLQTFYIKNGFALIKNNGNCHLMYYPKNIKEKL